MVRSHQLIKLSTLISALAFAGCASVADVKPGTSYNDVVKQFGKPVVSCPTQDGGKRVIWTEEPSGEFAWALNVNREGTVSDVTQTLHQDGFNVLNQGQWSAHDIVCQFGPPAKIQTFAEMANQVVWEYHYLNPIGAYYMLFISIDKTSNQLVQFWTGPDPELNPMFIAK